MTTRAAVSRAVGRVQAEGLPQGQFICPEEVKFSGSPRRHVSVGDKNKLVNVVLKPKA